NADLRLTPIAHDAALVGGAQWEHFRARRDRYHRNESTLKRVSINANADGAKSSVWQTLRRADTSLRELVTSQRIALDLHQTHHHLDLDSLEAAGRLEGYIARQA